MDDSCRDYFHRVTCGPRLFFIAGTISSSSNRATLMAGNTSQSSLDHVAVCVHCKPAGELYFLAFNGTGINKDLFNDRRLNGTDKVLLRFFAL